MEIRRCLVQEYPEFLREVNDAFGERQEWFEKNVSHCTPYPADADSELIGKHFVCISDGRIVGGLGAYPMRWAVCDDSGNRVVLPAYGIGQVFCAKSHRGQGIMARLMYAAEDDMRKMGNVLGCLDGVRSLYRRYSYDYSGNNVKYHVRKWELLKFAEKGPLSVRTVNLSDLPELESAYSSLPSGIVRANWDRLLIRPNFTWKIGESEGKKAYLVYSKPEEICEIYGDTAVAAAMLLDILQERDSLYVFYPKSTLSEMGRWLYDISHFMELVPLTKISVINPDGLLDVLGVDKDEMSESARHDVCKYLLGFSHNALTGDLPALEREPLCVWLSEVDRV
ncbi:MAG: GNAT family N-acetyltransferase [Oscillospiraceae bacterium]|nr:GNAT family N-acetyltransferase [Oscillospiraceae bacterium]MCL2280005.1 GNAT family N-acetyltransferase [Oscillospiraceae bacterium]